jgi:hypothetical protein
VGGGTFLGIVKPLGLDIQWRVDHLSTCGLILSCQAFNVAASQGPDSDGAYRVPEAPVRGCREPGHVPRWVTRLGHNQCPSVPCVQDPDNHTPASGSGT